MSNIKFNAIAAMCNENRGIGIDNRLPWSIPNDYEYFLRVVRTTLDKNKINALIVGRLTWLSIPLDHRPIEPCLNIIISSKLKQSDLEINPKADRNKILICNSVDDAIQLVNDKYSDQIENIYSIGGTEIYRTSIESNKFDRFYLTRVFETFKCDAFIQPENFLTMFKKLETHDLENEQSLFNIEYNKILTEPINGVKYVFEAYVKLKS